MATSALLLAASCGLVSAPTRRAPRAQSGIIDLRSWDFERDGPVALVGEWDFFPGKLLYGEDARRASGAGVRRVPDLWKGGDAGGRAGQGAATYRLRVLLPSSLGEPAIRYTTTSTSFELDAEGALVAAAGRPAADKAGAIAAYRPGVARLPRAERLDLVVRISNYEYRSGGMWRPFVIGPAYSLERAARTRQAISYAESTALAALALCYFFFFLNRRRQRTFLYFCLFLLAISLRALVTGEYVLVKIFPRLGFDVLIRLEYVSVFFSFPLAVHFFSSLFPEGSHRKLLLATIAPFVGLSVLLPWAPLPLLTRLIYVAYAVGTVATAATGVFVLMPAVFRREKDSILELIGGFILVVICLNDAFFASFIVQTGNLLPLGLLIFVGIQSYVLSRRFAAALDAAETLSAEKDILLKEVHHRVKNSLQIISSAIALQSHRSEDPVLLAALNATRSRIRAISLVHEKLYALDAPGSVELGDYVRDLSRQLEASYRREEGRAELAVEVDRIPVPQDLCIDVGLVLAELLSNAYRHAKGDGSGEGLVRVSLRKEGAIVVLRVADDGPGFPPGFSLEKPGGLGLSVAAGLARKRGGSLALDDGPGAVVELRMPIPGRANAGALADLKKET